MFAFLAGRWLLARPAMGGYAKVLTLALVMTAALGGLIELVQGPLPYRDLQVGDLVIDVAGALAGVILLAAAGLCGSADAEGVADDARCDLFGGDVVRAVRTRSFSVSRRCFWPRVAARCSRACRPGGRHPDAPSAAHYAYRMGAWPGLLTGVNS